MTDKVVVITGGSSGIGKALAHEFGMRGSKVVITGRRANPLLETEVALRGQGIQVDSFVGDVSCDEHNAQLIEYVLDLHGRIDVLINNAGVSMRAMFEEVDLDVFKSVMAINFQGAVTLTHYALPHILRSKGHIVGISSVSGRRAMPARSAYSASKYAMEGFLEALRTEVIHRGVTVTSICPGFVASNIRHRALTAHGVAQGESPRDESKMMSAAEAAAKIYRAVVAGKRDLVLTGQAKLAVWLNKFLPAWTDKIICREMNKEPGSPLKKHTLPTPVLERVKY